MTAVSGESILYSVAKTLRLGSPGSFYDLRAFASFLEIVCLHEEWIVVGQTDDLNFAEECDYVEGYVKERCGITIEFLSAGHVESLLKEHVEYDAEFRFDLVIESIYGKPFGIPIGDLLNKRMGDRVMDDFYDSLTNSILGASNDNAHIALREHLAERWFENRNFGGLHYLLRSNLVAMLAFAIGGTPFAAGPGLFSEILHRHAIPNHWLGTAGHQVYLASDTALFRRQLRQTGSHRSLYCPILVAEVLSRMDSESPIEESIVGLRRDFHNYREYFRELDTSLKKVSSIKKREGAQKKIENAINKVVVPIASGLSMKAQAPPQLEENESVAKNIVKGVFEETLTPPLGKTAARIFLDKPMANLISTMVAKWRHCRTLIECINRIVREERPPNILNSLSGPSKYSSLKISGALYGRRKKTEEQ